MTFQTQKVTEIISGKNNYNYLIIPLKTSVHNLKTLILEGSDFEFETTNIVTNLKEKWKLKFYKLQ